MRNDRDAGLANGHPDAFRASGRTAGGSNRRTGAASYWGGPPGRAAARPGVGHHDPFHPNRSQVADRSKQAAMVEPLDRAAYMFLPNAVPFDPSALVCAVRPTIPIGGSSFPAPDHIFAVH